MTVVDPAVDHPQELTSSIIGSDLLSYGVMKCDIVVSNVTDVLVPELSLWIYATLFLSRTPITMFC